MKNLFVAGAMAALLATPAFAKTEAECAKHFADADRDNNGVISMMEGARYYAFERLNSAVMTDGKLTKDAFMASCKAGRYDEAKNDEGAPLKGANSFTENQAKDRAIARGYADVSALKKDDDGIWRGTAVHNGKSVKLAVDYKGNVVGH